MPTKPPLFVLNAALPDLGDSWLEVHCCGGVMYMPGRLLGRGGPGARLRDVIARLRCRRCGSPPSAMALVDDPASGAAGGPPTTWRIPL